MLHIWVLDVKLMLVLNWKVHYYWIAFMVLGAMHTTLGERQSSKSSSSEHYKYKNIDNWCYNGIRVYIVIGIITNLWLHLKPKSVNWNLSVTIQRMKNLWLDQSGSNGTYSTLLNRHSIKMTYNDIVVSIDHSISLTLPETHFFLVDGN